jgi:hypothetical protein
MVALANGISLESKKAASNQNDLNTYHSSVKVVAGAGFVQDPTKTELRKSV